MSDRRTLLGGGNAASDLPVPMAGDALKALTVRQDAAGYELATPIYFYGSTFAAMADDTATWEIRSVEPLDAAPSFTPTVEQWGDAWGSDPPAPVVAGPFPAGAYLVRQDVYYEQTAGGVPAGSAALYPNVNQNPLSVAKAVLVDGSNPGEWTHLLLTEETWFYLEFEFTPATGIGASAAFVIAKIA